MQFWHLPGPPACSACLPMRPSSNTPNPPRKQVLLCHPQTKHLHHLLQLRLLGVRVHLRAGTGDRGRSSVPNEYMRTIQMEKSNRTRRREVVYALHAELEGGCMLS